MSSSWEPDSSSDAPEESLEDAMLSKKQQAHDSSRAGQQSNETQNRVEPPVAHKSGISSHLTQEEREIAIRDLAQRHEVALEYDHDGQLQPAYPRLQSKLFDDKPSPALWRHRTTYERDISANLDQVRSNDLSIHLYNTFKIRQRAKAQTPDENGFIETKEPPRAWAAWPMTSDTVPRDPQQRVSVDDDWRLGPYVKRERNAADELKELLTARATKTAKERFLARESENASDGDTSTEDDRGEDLRPVVTVDDEAVEKVLRPSIQHLLGRLDNLLVALHHARSSYIAPLRAERTQKVPESNTNSDKRSKVRVGSDDDSIEPSNSEDEKGESQNAGRQMTQRGKAEDVEVKFRSYFLRQKANTSSLRDWTDIFGVAYVTSIGSHVMSRLASRCNYLFDADEEFREIYGGLTNKEENVYLPYDGGSQHLAKIEIHDRETYDGVHVDGFMKSIQGDPYWKSISKKRKELKAQEAEMAVDGEDEDVSDDEFEDDSDEGSDEEKSDEEQNNSEESGESDGESDGKSDGELEDDSDESNYIPNDEDEI